MPATYNVRLIQAGNIVERIEYEKLVIVNEQSKNNSAAKCEYSGSRKNSERDGEKKKNRLKVIYRARNEVRRLINSNVGQYQDENHQPFKPVFLTLTFQRNITDLSVANREYRKFIKRFGYHVGDNESYIKYVVVPEFQKRGAVHYHLVIFNLPYIKAKIIARIWSHGYVKINAIDEVDNVGAYVCKYMTKDVLDGKEDKLAGQKCYFRSRDLIEPKEIRLLSDSPECKKLDELVSGMASSVAYDQEHDSEYYGTITYTQYRGENSCWKELFNTWQEMRAYQLR